MQSTPYLTLPATVTVNSDGIYLQRQLLVLLVPLCLQRPVSAAVAETVGCLVAMGGANVVFHLGSASHQLV